MTDPGLVRNRLLTVIAVLLATAGLQASYAVTMPLAVAATIIAAVWPVKVWFDRLLPPSLSYAGAILVLLLLLTSFSLAVYFAAAQAVAAFVRNEGQFETLYAQLTVGLAQLGLPDPGGRQGYARLIAFGQTILANAYTVTIYTGYIAVLVILGLPEVPTLRRKLSAALDRDDHREFLDTVGEIASKVRSYLAVSTVTSLLTGVASALWAFMLGLELALVWGVLNFLLNYLPVIGNIIGILPPTLYAFLQFDGWTLPALVFLGYAAIQIAISNFIYPMLQGRSLALSPAAILIALSFWSWIWGIAGALIAIPLTAALVIACEHFRSTAWIATVLSSSNRR